MKVLYSVVRSLLLIMISGNIGSINPREKVIFSSESSKKALVIMVNTRSEVIHICAYLCD